MADVGRPAPLAALQATGVAGQAGGLSSSYWQMRRSMWAVPKEAAGGFGGFGGRRQPGAGLFKLLRQPGAAIAIDRSMAPVPARWPGGEAAQQGACEPHWLQSLQ